MSGEPQPTPAGHGLRPDQRLVLTDDMGGKVRNLLVRRQAARDAASEYRRKGQLVPASLAEDISDIGAQLQWAVSRFNATRDDGSSSLRL